MDRFDDPRWQGAVGHSLLNGDAEFRAVHRGNNIYLSWRAKFDPGGINQNADGIWVGIKENTGRVVIIGLFIIEATVPLTARPHDPAAEPAYYSVEVYTQDPNFEDPDDPAWIKDTARVWTKSLFGDVWEWAFQIVVPLVGTPDLDSGLNIGPTFKMWYTLVVAAPTVLPVQYHWPTTRTVDITRDANGLPNPPHPSVDANFDDFRLSPAVQGCAGDVALAANQIATENMPNSRIDPAQPNAFFARPENIRPEGSSPIAQRAISARFYVANWGTQPDEPNSVGDPTKLWCEISKIGSRPVPHNQGPIDAGTTAHGAPNRNDITFSWTVGENECLSGSDVWDHQCVLVVMSGCECETQACTECVGQPSLVFRNQSVYRNMDFETTSSSFSRKAAVSVVGLDSIPGSGPKRTVYLYVETRNMPSKVEARAGDRDTFIVPGTFSLDLTRSDSAAVMGADRFKLLGPARISWPGRDTVAVPSSGSGARGVALRRAAENGVIETDQIDSLMPTFRVHAYHESGDSTTINGVKRPVLHAQTSFGYWIDHRGDLQGWDYELEGAELVTLAPNFYKIEVPNNSFVPITTRIEAITPKRFAISLHAGVSLPHGNFSNAVDPGFGVTADFELRLNHTFTAEALVGFHRFKGAASSADVDLTHLSGGLRAYLTPGPTRLFVSAGGGTYTFDPGGTDPGAHAGAGVQFNPSHRIALEAVYTAHTVFTSGSSTTFSSIQAGGRIRL